VSQKTTRYISKITALSFMNFFSWSFSWSCGGFRHVSHVQANRSLAKMLGSGATFSGQWHLNDVLQLSEVYLLQHGILWSGRAMYTILRNPKFTTLLTYLYLVIIETDAQLYKASEFRRPYLKSCSSSKASAVVVLKSCQKIDVSIPTFFTEQCLNGL